MRQDTVWTLPSLTNWALLHNPQTAQAWAALRASADALGIAKGLWLPTATLQAQDQITSTNYGGGIPPVRGEAIRNNLSISEIIYDFGQRQATIAQSRTAMWVAQYQSDAAIQQVARTLAVDYYSYAYTTSVVTALSAAVEDAKRLAITTKMLYQAHLRPITDMYSAEVQLSQVRAQWELAKGSEFSARGALAQAAGMPVDQVIRVVPLDLPPKELPANIHLLLQRALKKNPSILASLASIQQARAALDLAKSQERPTISLVASAGNDIYHNKPDTNTYNVGIQITIPFDANFTQHYSSGQQYELLQEAKAQSDVEVATIEQDAWQAYHSLQASWRAYLTDTNQVHSAELELSGVRKQYKMGLATILDVVTAEQNVTAAKIASSQELANIYQYYCEVVSFIGVSPYSWQNNSANKK